MGELYPIAKTLLVQATMNLDSVFPDSQTVSIVESCPRAWCRFWKSMEALRGAAEQLVLGLQGTMLLRGHRHWCKLQLHLLLYWSFLVLIPPENCRLICGGYWMMKPSPRSSVMELDTMISKLWGSLILHRVW